MLFQTAWREPLCGVRHSLGPRIPRAYPKCVCKGLEGPLALERAAKGYICGSGKSSTPSGSAKNKVPEDEVGGFIFGPRKSSTPLGEAKKIRVRETGSADEFPDPGNGARRRRTLKMSVRQTGSAHAFLDIGKETRRWETLEKSTIIRILARPVVL